jgi:hypothetical protein
MKNIKHLLAACVMLLVFGACGNIHNKKVDTKEPTVTTSPDLAFWDLKGPVKMCDGVEFDRQGKTVKVDNYDPFAIDGPYRDYDTVTGSFTEYCQWTRNSEGYMEEMLCVESINNYVWEDGRVVEEIGSGEGIEWDVRYQYNPDGLLLGTYLYYLDEEGQKELVEITEYEYLDFDTHGNWTRRKVTNRDVTIGYVNENVVTRTIQYYE